ncbi:COR domain-containing protein [Desulfococcaceae bacterium HSG8]|nr:COR domain-containing protein [Desulfococcaceae bacterium HSG8]
MSQEDISEIIRKAEKEQAVVLDLSGRGLTHLPPEIGKLRNLFVLYLGSNQLAGLPKEVAHLRNLTQLDLSRNQLSELPREIFQLKNIFRLDVSNNQLSELPKEIVQVKNLTILDVSYNQLRKLPTEIVYLKNLKILDLDYNPLIFPPVEIVNQGISAVTEYLEKSDKGGHLFYEGKLMLVGQGGVGKTCLMERLILGKYTEKQTTTEGIDIRSWKVTASDEMQTQMTLNVWDFGGQEIYHATHQFFLTRCSLYILVWDARQEEEHSRIDYWLNIIDTFAEDSPILLVMNKADERIKDLNISELKQIYPQVIASGKVSAKDGTGIGSLRNLIRKQAWELPLMGTFWPSSWLSIRRALKATPRYHVPYEKYLQLCRKADIDKGEAMTLSRYLHDLGIVLHFQDDPLLKDTIILKPEWGTDAVYKVLDAKPVRDRNGILYHKDLPEIWKDNELYPPDKYATILRLMENFELAFPSGKDRYIVAELLFPKRVEYEWDFRGCLQFEYHYDFLPAGLINRLIVRMHEYLIEHNGKKLCWREGAYFEYEESQAMAKFNPYAKVATIQTSGIGKRDFLAVIRSHFGELHKTIRKIRYKEMVPCTCTPDCRYRFDYNFLLKCEEKGKTTQTCQVTVEEVDVEALLNRAERPEVRQERIRKKTEDKYFIEASINAMTEEADMIQNDTDPEYESRTLYQRLRKVFSGLLGGKSEDEKPDQ